MTTAIVLQKCSVFVTNKKANTEQDSSTGKNTTNKKLRKYVILNIFIGMILKYQRFQT